MTRDQMFAWAAVFSRQLQTAILGADERNLPVLARQIELLPELLTPAPDGVWRLTFETEPARIAGNAQPGDEDAR